MRKTAFIVAQDFEGRNDQDEYGSVESEEGEGYNHDATVGRKVLVSPSLPL
jgi:hypothetical protein